MTTSTKKLAIALHDEASQERILTSTESDSIAIADLFQKLDALKRVDKELVQEMDSNFEAIKGVEEEIRKKQSALKEGAINLKKRARPGSQQVERLHCMTHTAKRNRQSSLAGTRQMHPDLHKFPSLFTPGSPGSPSMSICALGTRDGCRASGIDDRFSSMPKEELPVVIQICFRLWPLGPYAFKNYQFGAIIKTDPSKPKLSADHIADLINGMGYDGEVDDITTVKTANPSLGYTQVGGHLSDDGLRPE